jgi:phosphoribosyl 1,2-cyclic phosphate phosphodiesterase
MSIAITMLGSGSSMGVPEVGCDCAVCQSPNPKNKRSRVSLLVETQGKKLLVDTSPDLRQQALANRISGIDAVLYTHDHADHIHGLDEVRSFNVRADASIPAWAEPHTLQTLTTRFPYAFKPKPQRAWYRPSLTPHEIPVSPLADFKVEGVKITPFWQHHADVQSLGFRVGNFAYCTDVNGFPAESLAKLQNLELWIVDCLRYKPSYTHSTLEMTLGWIAQIKPKLTILTHMAHDFDYDTLSRELPPNVIPGYDGLRIVLG